MPLTFAQSGGASSIGHAIADTRRRLSTSRSARRGALPPQRLRLHARATSGPTTRPRSAATTRSVDAPFYLTEAYNDFISNSEDDYIDGRYKNLSYSSLYPNQMRRIFAQIMQNDPMTYRAVRRSAAGEAGAPARSTSSTCRGRSTTRAISSTISLEYSARRRRARSARRLGGAVSRAHQPASSSGRRR